MTRRLPTLALLLGIGGLIPFLACGFFAVWELDPIRRTLFAGALIAYGAVILSFLGAVHWGIAIEDQASLADRERLGLGVLPALAGWVALLAFIVAQPLVALGILIAGFVVVLVVESRATRRGLLGRGYMGMRWGISIVTIAILVTVLVIRLGGFHLQG